MNPHNLTDEKTRRVKNRRGTDLKDANEIDLSYPHVACGLILPPSACSSFIVSMSWLWNLVSTTHRNIFSRSYHGNTVLDTVACVDVALNPILLTICWPINQSVSPLDVLINAAHLSHNDAIWQVRWRQWWSFQAGELVSAESRMGNLSDEEKMMKLCINSRKSLTPKQDFNFEEYETKQLPCRCFSEPKTCKSQCVFLRGKDWHEWDDCHDSKDLQFSTWSNENKQKKARTWNLLASNHAKMIVPIHRVTSQCLASTTMIRFSHSFNCSRLMNCKKCCSLSNTRGNNWVSEVHQRIASDTFRLRRKSKVVTPSDGLHRRKRRVFPYQPMINCAFRQRPMLTSVYISTRLKLTVCAQPGSNNGHVFHMKTVTLVIIPTVEIVPQQFTWNFKQVSSYMKWWNSPATLTCKHQSIVT